MSGMPSQSPCERLHCILRRRVCRSVYRTIELSNGWTGYIIHTQRYFGTSPTSTRFALYSPLYMIDWLDGGMVCLAMFTMNVFHPGLLLGKADTWTPIAPAPASSQTDVKTPALLSDGGEI